MKGRAVILFGLLATAVACPVAVLFFSRWNIWTALAAVGASAFWVLAAAAYGACCVSGDISEMEAEHDGRA